MALKADNLTVIFPDDAPQVAAPPPASPMLALDTGAVPARLRGDVYGLFYRLGRLLDEYRVRSNGSPIHPAMLSEHTPLPELAHDCSLLAYALADALDAKDRK